ncbi:alpha-L-fucosidase [Chitinophaga terrae (ex Kim and Jung 2007)]|uniref:alpha-L-fucosidase n=1 Tax=Chitinophaga terrae (ex Kim and Jung 2007) TaxID=408074 RepID=UPI00277F24D4|nr:alpha-L-fucosidase [Chitinophaga terrae (ex Kim and Jung 2007)]MDQ0109194.1 alpha-L-fucosidase [Chitinophaga terrae (ex Kim and Jung 2007)]
MKKCWIGTFLLLFSVSLTAQKKFEANWNSLNTRGIPTWFNDAKFGIFIHWGVYAVPSFAVVAPGGYSEWYWHTLNSGNKANKEFHEKNYGKDFQYQDFEKQFTASLYNPAQWADIFRRSGAKYVVLTSKHHEGYCLWDSKQADASWGRPWNAVTGTPKRDLLGDLTNEVRKAGLKMGFYYSLYEWYNPLWLKDRAKYVDEVMTPQFKDLVTKYKPSVIFSDGEWEMSDTAWKSPALLAWLFNESPVKDEVAVDDRWGNNTRGHNNGATYLTSEYGAGMQPGVIWEESQGIGQSYGYNRMESADDYKKSGELILMLVDIVSRGGNLLLDIGPTADGRIPVIMQQKLLEIGKWLEVNGEAIYETKPCKTPYQWSAGKIPEGDKEAYMSKFKVAELVKPSKEHANIELFFTQKPGVLYCFVPGYRDKVVIRDYNRKAAVEVLGVKKPVKTQVQGKNLLVDLSNLRPGDLGEGPIVIKLKG